MNPPGKMEAVLSRARVPKRNAVTAWAVGCPELELRAPALPNPKAAWQARGRQRVWAQAGLEARVSRVLEWRARQEARNPA